MISIFDLSIIIVTGLAVFFDLTVRRIPNWLILFGLTSALLLNAMHGLGPFTHSVLGFFAGIAVLIFPFALGWLGAGDVKYFAVVGAFLGVA
ncbi:MAG: prepilin peptidase, partial [Gammaproteobacteria bacterium]